MWLRLAACAWLAVLAGCAGAGSDATSMAIAEAAQREIAAHPAEYSHGDARAFAISRDGLPRGLLWGTMHTGYDDTTIPPAATRKRLGGSKDLTVEVALDTTSASQMAVLFAPCGRAALQADPAAYGALDTSTRAAVEALTLSRKPTELSLLGLFYAMLAQPGGGLTQTALPSGGSPDLILSRTARGEGVQVHSLERAAMQVALLCSAPNGPVAAMQLRLEVRRRTDRSELRSYVRDSYRRGRIATLMAALLAWRLEEGDRPALRQFRQETLANRNVVMARKVSARLKEDGQHFIAIGAGHLIGDDGVVELLIRDGWTLTPCSADRCPDA